MPTIILRQAQDEAKRLKVLTLTLSLSKGEGGHSHFFSSLLEQIHRVDGSPKAIPSDPDLL